MVRASPTSFVAIAFFVGSALAHSAEPQCAVPGSITEGDEVSFLQSTVSLHGKRQLLSRRKDHCEQQEFLLSPGMCVKCIQGWFERANPGEGKSGYVGGKANNAERILAYKNEIRRGAFGGGEHAHGAPSIWTTNNVPTLKQGPTIHHAGPGTNMGHALSHSKKSGGMRSECTERTSMYHLDSQPLAVEKVTLVCQRFETERKFSSDYTQEQVCDSCNCRCTKGSYDPKGNAIDVTIDDAQCWSYDPKGNAEWHAKIRVLEQKDADAVQARSAEDQRKAELKRQCQDEAAKAPDCEEPLNGNCDSHMGPRTVIRLQFIGPQLMSRCRVDVPACVQLSTEMPKFEAVKRPFCREHSDGGGETYHRPSCCVRNSDGVAYWTHELGEISRKCGGCPGYR